MTGAASPGFARGVARSLAGDGVPVWRRSETTRTRGTRTRTRAINDGKRTFLTVLVRTRPMVYGESCVYDVAVRAGEGWNSAGGWLKYEAEACECRSSSKHENIVCIRCHVLT